MSSDLKHIGEETEPSHRLLAQWRESPSCDECYLSNNRKQLYTLKVQGLDVKATKIHLAHPGGRQSPIDIGTQWQVNLPFKNGMAQIPVRKLVLDEEGLHLELAYKGTRLQRRRNVRIASAFAQESSCRFHFENKLIQARILNISTGGLGLRLEENHNLTVGSLVQNGDFTIGENEASFKKAVVAHMDQTNRGVFLGLAFDDLTLTKAETVEKVFAAFMEDQA